jgi:hypothetical protein
MSVPMSMRQSRHYDDDRRVFGPQTLTDVASRPAGLALGRVANVPKERTKRAIYFFFDAARSAAASAACALGPSDFFDSTLPVPASMATSTIEVFPGTLISNE